MKKRAWMSWSMALLLILNLLAPLGTVYAVGATDKTAVLTNVGVTVKQNGTEITGTTLPDADNLSVEVSFGVPVAGDDTEGNPDPSTIVLKGDTADISLGKGFTLSAVGGSLPIDLTVSGKTVIGHVTAFNTDPATKNITAHVVFDGAVMDDDSVSGIHAGFKASLQVNSDGGQDGNGNTIFTILNKTYTIVPPAIPATYTVTKSGTVDLANKCINWIVNITAAKGSTPIDLVGYTFSDDLKNVGAYKAGTFQVGPSSGTLTQQTPNTIDPALKYLFPSGSTSPQSVTFSTSLTDAECYSTTGWTKNNTAQLKKGDDVVAEKEGTAPFTPKWIEKAGVANNETVPNTGAYDPQNQTITWTITANQMGASLDGMVITDALQDGLIWQSAKVQTWDAASKTWVDSSTTWNTEPTDGKYELASINTMVLLTIVTKAPEADYTTGKTTYHNAASISWTGLTGDGIGTGNIGVDVGYNAITKTGKLDDHYLTNRTIHWRVTVDPKGQTIPIMKVYDLLVYGKSIDLSKVTGIPDGIDSKNLTPQYGQKYLTNTFNGAGTLTNVYELKDSHGKAVADLLEVDLSGTAASTFTFDTQIVNPDIYAGNATPSVYNTATLFSANAKLNEATAPVSYPSHMLAKEMLRRGSDPTTTARANNKTTNAAEGFDYKDKSVIFRLSVNADGMDLTNMPIDVQGTTLGNVTVTDTLPEGWVFDKIDGKDFLIFVGSAGSDKSVTATGDALTDTSFVTPDFNGTTSDGKQKTATFTFSMLDKPYVILVKARPTDETAARYFSQTQSKTVTNGLNLKAENWTPGVSTSQNVTIDSTILSKNLDSSKADSQAQLTWTVEYKPYNLDGKGTRIEDTLPVGIDLRTDSSGKLVLTDKDGNANIAINEMTLKTDGTYTLGASVLPELGKNVSYDNTGRVLTFKIPDSKTAYRFTYVTDITGNSGSITNQVKLYGSDSSGVGTHNDYTIVEQSGWATLQRGGSLTITKTDGTGKATLTDAEFTLFATPENGGAVIRKGTVTTDGTLKMRAIPEGRYILRETAIPGGYLSENVSATPTDHTVTVTVSGSTVTTSIDGKTGADSNTLTVKNYKAGTVGNLTISKTVAGNAADTKKTFDFTVTFANANGAYMYTKDGVAAGTISSGDKISLAHGQSITVAGLPKSTTYVVTESNYSADGYSTVSTVTAAKTVGDNSTATGGTVTGTIVADDTQTASFTNTRNVYVPSTGNLTISKTVAGPGADTAKKFNFTVTFTGAPGSYPYTGNGVPDGTTQSGDTIALAHGQSITITGLPAGASYQVSEDAASAQGYTMESAGSSGSISVGGSQTAAFTNTKIPDSGSLTISKTVTGKGASLTRKFKFTVILTGAPDAYPYTGSASGTLRSGDMVTLSNGQSITIADLPAGAGYSVTEADYSDVGYTTSSTGASSAISPGATQTASFTNSWNPLPNEPGKPENPTVDIGDEDIPTGNTDNGGPDVPGGGNEANTPDGEENSLPRTGDDQTDDLAKFGLFFFSAALAVFAAADHVLRRKNPGKKNK